MTPELLSAEIRDRAVRIASRIVGPEDAEDVVQNAYLSALRTKHPFRGKCDPFTWFCRVTINQSFMLLRQRKSVKEQTVETLPEVISKDIPADLRIERKECRRAVLNAIENIGRGKSKNFHGAPIRALLSVYFIYPDLTVAEIAAIQGMKTEAVKASLHRGREALAQILSQ